MIDTRRFPPLLIAVALVILLIQAADLALLLPTTDLATPAGRVRLILAVEGRSPALLIADLLLIWALCSAGLRGALRVTGILHLVFGLLFVILLPWLLVDAGRLAGDFAGPEALAFRISVGRALLLLLLFGIGALLAGRVLYSLVGETVAAA